MSASEDRVSQSRKLLEGLLTELGALRNANIRDTGFKQWRQNALTAIQRIWSGDSSRSDRFRRVPFSPPSSRSDVKTTREFYERGCAEAQQLLRSLIEEIDRSGVPVVHEEAASRGFAPGSTEDDFPTLDLGGDPAPPEPAAREKPAKPPAEPSAPPESDARPAARAPRGGKRSGGKQRLKDMLGFDALDPEQAEAAPEADEPEPPEPPKAAKPAPAARPARRPAGRAGARPAARREPPPPEFQMPPGEEAVEAMADEEVADFDEMLAAANASAESAAVPEVEEADDGADDARESGEPAEAGSGNADVRLEELEEHEPLEEEPPEEEDEEPELDPARLEQAMADFLRTSPVFAAVPRPLAKGKPASEPETPMPSPTALALAAVAAEVADLGIAEGQRAQTRAALLALARQFDSRELSWDQLREAVDFLMGHPPLARRVLPLLVPFLDRAA